jgi:hypothetical protein
MTRVVDSITDHYYLEDGATEYVIAKRSQHNLQSVKDYPYSFLRHSCDFLIANYINYVCRYHALFKPEVSKHEFPSLC